MAKTVNPNSVLFLYEGETEAEFYKKVFEEKIPSRELRRNYGNLKGVYSLNDKVKSKIEAYLSNESYEDCKQIHVFVAYDREGPRQVDTLLDIRSMREKYLREGSRIASINEIVATQDLESWFFHDIEGIYKYLKVPKAERNPRNYANIDATNNRMLSSLFHRYDKHYQKGRRVVGFLDQLDIEKIYNSVHELQTSIAAIQQLC